MTTESVDALKARVRTRNLSTGNDPDTPLRDFEGVFSPGGWLAHLVQPRSGVGEPRIFAQMQFTEVEVFDSVAPYDYPNAELDLPTSDRDQSQWGYLNHSSYVFLSEDQDLDSLAGHRLHIEWAKEFYGEHPRNPDKGFGMWPCLAWNGKRGEEADDEVRAFWTIVAVDGITAEAASGMVGSVLGAESLTTVSAEDVDAAIINALDGNSAPDGVRAVMQLDSVRGDSDLTARVMGTDDGDGIVAELLGSGVLTQDDDKVLHKA